MTKVIEIIVVGDTGSGKSHVLDLLARALRGEYGMHAQITSHELSLENNLGHELLKPRIADTIFNLREQGIGLSTLGREPDPIEESPAVKAAIDDYWKRVSDGVFIYGPQQGFALDPLEQAIASTSAIMRDERESMADLSKRLDQGMRASALHDRMGRHLDQLLAAQLKKVAA